MVQLKGNRNVIRVAIYEISIAPAVKYRYIKVVGNEAGTSPWWYRYSREYVMVLGRLFWINIFAFSSLEYGVHTRTQSDHESRVGACHRVNI